MCPTYGSTSFTHEHAGTAPRVYFSRAQACSNPGVRERESPRSHREINEGSIPVALERCAGRWPVCLRYLLSSADPRVTRYVCPKRRCLVKSHAGFGTILLTYRTAHVTVSHA